MAASQTGSNDTRQEMSDKQQPEQKSLPVIHKKDDGRWVTGWTVIPEEFIFNNSKQLDVF